jgi:hypothetical protein
MDDTPTRERIRLQHRIGTFMEMYPNGDEVHKVYGTGYEIHLKGKNVLIKGDSKNIPLFIFFCVCDNGGEMGIEPVVLLNIYYWLIYIDIYLCKEL